MPDSTRPAPPATTSAILGRYYGAMAAPFAIDVLTMVAYVAINDAPRLLWPSIALAAVFLVGGVGAGAWWLIRPVRLFLQGRRPFAEIERPLAHLPRASAILVGICYAPVLMLRMLTEQFGFTLGAALPKVAWTDAIASVVVGTGFDVVLTFFVVSAYLDRLCQHIFETTGANIAVFHGRFRRKVGFALIFVSFAAMILLLGDILSYQGDRLLREATSDVVASVIGALVVYYWITRALNLPLLRLDRGMHRVARNDYAIRLPVTSADEMGHAASQFNAMVAGLAEREYLRDTFGKYVSESVAAAILAGGERGGRTVDTTAEATLMFTDIEGFTGLSEHLAPTQVAELLNSHLAAMVPVIQRHGGVVNNFIGDGLFASFNLPLPLERHAAAAIEAAREIRRTLEATALPGGSRLRTRIGLNTGPVIGVTIGTERRMSYTLLGDAVNVASRVEQLNKHFGTTILATGSTVRAAGAEACCTPLGTADIRGHRGTVEVWRVGEP